MQLLQSSKDISGDVLDGWGDQIGSRKISREIASLERFSDRVLSRVLEGDDEDEGAANGQYHNAEAAYNTGGLGAGAMGMAAGAALANSGQHSIAQSEEDLQAGKMLSANAQEFLNICGIAVYGNIYRKNVSKSEFGSISRNFSAQELKIGCRVVNVHKQFNNSQMDMSRLTELTQTAGSHCLAVWVSAMPKRFRKEMEMIGVHSGSFSSNDQIGISDEHAIDVVRSVARQLTEV